MDFSREVSLVLYLLVCAVSAGFFSYGIKHKDIISGYCCVCGFVILVMFAALRNGVGTDFYTYQSMYNRYASMSWNQFWVAPPEILFYALIKVIFSLGGNVFVANGVMAFLTIYPVFRYVKDCSFASREAYLAFFAFIISCFFGSFNIIRQSIAAAIVLYASQFIIQNSNKKYFLLVLVACGFHVSAVLAVPLYFLWNHKTGKPLGMKIAIPSICIVSVLFIFAQPIVIFIGNWFPSLSRYSGYFNEFDKGANREIFLRVIELIAILILRPYAKSKLHYEIDFYVYCALIMVLSTLFGFFNTYAKRVGMYYRLPFTVFFFSIAPMCFKVRERFVIRIMIIVYLTLQFVVSSFILGNSDIIPYRTI